MRRKLLIGALATILLGGAWASAEPTAAEQFGAWTGHANHTTEPFEAGGTWRLTLGAWCFEAVGFVSVVVHHVDGTEVGDVIVMGEGVESVVLETEPGEYYLEVTVSHHHVYTWEVLAEPVMDDEAPAGASGGASSDAPVAAATEIVAVRG